MGAAMRVGLFRRWANVQVQGRRRQGELTGPLGRDQRGRRCAVVVVSAAAAAAPSSGLAAGSFVCALALVAARAADRRLLLPILAASVPAPVAALAMAERGRWVSFPLVLWVLARATQRTEAAGAARAGDARPLGGATWEALTSAADWTEAAGLGWLLLATTPAPLAPLFQGGGASALVALALALVLWRPQPNGTMAWVRRTADHEGSGLGALLNLVLLTGLTVANAGRVMLATSLWGPS